MDEVYRGLCMLASHRAKGSLKAFVNHVDKTFDFDETDNLETLWKKIGDAGLLPRVCKLFRAWYGEQTSVKVLASDIRALEPDDPLRKKNKEYLFLVTAFIEYKGYYLFESDDIAKATLDDYSMSLHGNASARRPFDKFFTESFLGKSGAPIDTQMLDDAWDNLGRIPLTDLKDDDRLEKLFTRELGCDVNTRATRAGYQRIMVVYPLLKERDMPWYSGVNPWRIGDSEDYRLVIREPKNN